MFGNTGAWRTSFVSFLGPGKMIMNTVPNNIVRHQYNHGTRIFGPYKGPLRSQWSLNGFLGCVEGMPGRKWVGLGGCRAGGHSIYLRGWWSGRLITQEANHQPNSRHLRPVPMTGCTCRGREKTIFHWLILCLSGLRKTLKWLKKKNLELT